MPPTPAKLPTLRRALLALLALVVTVGVVAAPAGAAGPAPPVRLTNLAHLDFLGDRVAPPEQSGHTTWRIDREPEIGVLWTYAEPQPDGSYRRLGGGTYDPATDTWGQGAFNADDMTRAAVVYLRHWRQFGDQASRDRAYQLLRGVTYLQTSSGPDAGNVVLWMQPDGTLNPSPTPTEEPDPSDSGPSYWLARTIWALGEGYAAFRAADPAFAGFLRERLELSLDALDRQVLDPRYGTYQTVDGLRLPAWLIVDGADASSEAVYGLAAYVRAGGPARARLDLRRLADGVARMPLGDVRDWPYGALLPWARSRSLWHAWGDQMAGSLAEAGRALGREDWVRVAVGETGRFTPHLLAQGGPENGWLPAPTDRVQIAYGADATLQNLLRTAAAARRPAFADLAGIAGAWYFGNNPAGVAMYDPATGRTFDGINPDRTVNRNSGAESTIHGLLSMLALDAHPAVAARARVAGRQAQVTWQLVEAEAGTLDGAAEVVTPASAWTGESAWSGGAYVRLGPGGRVSGTVDLPVGGGWWLFPVLDRMQISAGMVGTRHRLGGASAGRVDHGGAGAQGVTAVPGFLDLGTTGPVEAGAGPADLVSTYAGTGPEARLDAVMAQPAVEWLVLAGGGGGQAVARSFARHREVRVLDLAGSGPASARSYDRAGRLVEVVTSPGGHLRVPVAPGGFTVASR
ncbi:MAG TPA: hypothetical protein VG499_18445 [Actinomycetota bacterium]|nr:hypothetical protein [Actinomycetota bacterium]